MRLIAACIVLSLWPVTGFAGDAPSSYISEYTVSAFGIPVGKSRFTTVISGNTYIFEGSVRSSGLAQLLAPTRGRLQASGSFGADAVRAESFVMSYTSGDDAQRTEMAFDNGRVSSTLNEPKVRKSADWIEVPAKHLRDALDPISALLIPATSRGEVCNRTIRIFDGAMRSDIKLSYLRTVPFYTRGYRGEAVTCRARFIPVSGYRSKKKEIEWMRTKGRIDVAFAQIEGKQLFAPVIATIGTKIGTVRIRATRFEAERQ